MQLSTPLVTAALALALLAPAADAQSPSKERRNPQGHAWHGGEEAFADRRGTPATAILLNPDGSQGDVIEYIDYDGEAIYGGDMVLYVDEHGYASFQRDRLDMRPTKSSGRTAASSLWPGGIVYYDIDPAVSSKFTGWIYDAMDEWESLTQIRFVKRTGQADYIYFTAASGCKSSVGRQGGGQNVWITGCSQKGSTIHEIGHAVGLFHEHTRADRDHYVRINWSNVESGQDHNFEKYTVDYSDGADLGGYDFRSIMHYGCWSFSTGGKTIRPLSNVSSRCNVMGQRSGLSSGDIAGIAMLYPRVTLVAMNYSGTTGQGNTIYQIDPHNGSTSQSRSLMGGSCVSDMDFQPGTSTLYGVDCSDTTHGAGSTILQIRSSDGAILPLLSLGGGREATSIAMDPDNIFDLYAIDQQGTGWGTKLYRVNVLSRQVTEIGTLSGSRTQATSIAFSEDGTLYAIDNTYNNGAGAVLFTINTATAQTSTIGWMRGDRTHATSIRFGAGGTLYGINNNANGKGKVLFMIDTEDARTTDIATLSGEQGWATALAVRH